MADPVAEGFDEKKFLADLRLTISKSHDRVFDEALKRVVNGSELISDGQFEHLIGQTAAVADSPPEEARVVLSTVSTLATAMFVEDEDGTLDADLIVRTFAKIAPPNKGGLTPQEKDSLFALLQRIQQDNHVKRVFDRARNIRGVLPMFREIKASMELRSTRNPFAESAEKMVAAKLVPIASIRISLDAGQPDFFSFQATEEDLATLITSLGKLQTQLKRIKEDAKDTRV